MPKFKFVFRYVLPTLVAFFAVNSAHAAENFPVKLASLGDDGVCGEMADGTISCFDYKLNYLGSIAAISSIAGPDDVYTSNYGVCVRDADGVNCSFEDSRIPLRDLLISSVPGSVKAGSSGACGIEAGTGTLICLAPEWYDLARKSFRQKLRNPVGAMGIAYGRICWADGDQIDCRVSGSTELKTINFKATEIAVPGQLCARNETEAKCWPDGGAELVLSKEFVNAKKWFYDDFNSFCAITQDDRLVCLDFTTGGPDLTNAIGIPPEFQVAGSGVAFFHVYSSYEFCAAFAGKSTANCWSAGSPPSVLNFPSEIVAMKSAGESVCALLKSGELECRDMRNTPKHKFLKKGGPIQLVNSLKGRCSANHNGVVCESAPALETLTAVTALAGDRSGAHYCAIGKQGSALTSVHCSLNGQPQTIPYLLPQANLISVGKTQACAIEAGNVYCWGAEYAGEKRTTTFQNAKRLVLGQRHACAVDDFGLVCWGDLKTKNLEVPLGLTGAGDVLDVALGLGRTCALLRDQTVKCWGEADANNQEPPALAGVTEIVGSREHAFCAKNTSGYHCWGGYTSYPK